MKQVLIGVLLLCLIGAGVAAYISATLPKEQKAEARFMPAVAPPGIETKVLDWAGKAVADIMTFDDQNADAHFRHTVARYFTDDGYATFFAAMQRSRIMESVEAQGQTVHAALAGAGKATYGMLDATPVWEIEVPAAVDYATDKSTRKDNMKITLRVTAPPQSPEDFHIMQWIAR